jgi:hypothetical protein
MSQFFVYTEVQISVPFDQAPWRELSPALKAQPGFQNKTWLSGVQNDSIGGLYEFDSLESATRIFDGNVTEEASRFLDSPYYT